MDSWHYAKFKRTILYAYINYLTVSGAVLAKIFWQYSKLFLKTFGKIGRRVETDNIAYFIDSVFSGLNQLGCHFQPFQLNKLIGGNLSDSLYFRCRLERLIFIFSANISTLKSGSEMFF